MKFARILYYILAVCSLAVSGYTVYHTTVTGENLLYAIVFSALLLVMAAVGFVRTKSTPETAGKIAAFSSFIGVFTYFNLKIMSHVKIPNNYSFILRDEAHILAKYLFFAAIVFAAVMTVIAMVVSKKHSDLVPSKPVRTLGLFAIMLCAIYLLALTVLSGIAFVLFLNISGGVIYDTLLIIAIAVSLAVTVALTVFALKTSSLSVITANASLMALICVILYDGTADTIYSSFMSLNNTENSAVTVYNIIFICLLVIEVLVCAYAITSALATPKEQTADGESTDLPPVETE